jgi:hypothetical protein
MASEQILVYDGEDFRFYKEKWYTLRRMHNTTAGSGITVWENNEEDETFIGWVTGRQLLDLAKENKNGA